MRQIRDRFDRYSLLFPNDVINLENELRQLENEIKIQFDEDLGKIKRFLNHNRTSICINFKNFEDYFYLYKTALYLDTQIPDTNNKIIRFCIANLYICKEVILVLLRYMHNQVIRNIRLSLDDYERRVNNRLIEEFHNFIGSCRNISRILTDYMVFYNQVEIKLGVGTQALILKRPTRVEIREGVKQSLINTKSGQKVALPSVRLALEFTILEDVGTKIMQRLKEKSCYNDIKEIIFTRKMTTDELFVIMKQMKLCTDNEIDILKGIHEWGSRSVHQGQIIPTSIIWYCLFFVEDQLRNILHSDSKLEFDETRKKYIQLLYDEKIKVISEWQTFIPSFYNVS